MADKMIKKGENNMIINKIISPCICDTRKERGRARAFVKIEYSDGVLSLVGVIGPRKNGSSSGGCGQCIDAISQGTPVDGWTSDMLERLCEIWRTSGGHGTSTISDRTVEKFRKT